MGQFALGIRSLLFKLAIFVIMAALLAWALGGTLWPRPAKVEFSAGSFLGHDVFWQLSVRNFDADDGGDPAKNVRWELLYRDNDGKLHGFEAMKDFQLHEVAGPVLSNGKLYCAGWPIMLGDSGKGNWALLTIDENRNIAGRASMPDRLAVEQQLARLRAGLPLQDEQTILRQRAAVLDPPANSADEQGHSP